jgi:hypothetical protein
MRIAIVALVAATLASTTARAEMIDGPDGSHVRVYKPKDWAAQAAVQGTEALMVAIAPANDAAVIYAVAEAKNADAGLKFLDDFTGKLIKNPKITKGSKVTIAGMPGIGFGATATAVDGGKPVEVVAVILQVNDSHVLFAIAMSHADARGKYKADLEKALSGIQKS